MYLAATPSMQGNQDEAEKRYKRAVDDGPKPYASLARIALSQIYISEGKMADAEKVLREAIANPTPTVSKEQATLVLGEVLAQSNPAEARKLLDPLRTSTRSAISRLGLAIPPKKQDAPAKPSSRQAPSGLPRGARWLA